MRFERLTAERLGPFERVELDLRRVHGRVIAVTGANGAGKSTLLELCAGALYRSCPTRGALRDLASSRSSWVEAEVVNGARWTVRQMIDAVSGKGECLILDEAGLPAVESGKVRDADAWVRNHLPPPEVVYASLFGVQGSEGFLAARPAERKAILTRILGVEHLEVLAGAARERSRDAQTELRVVHARLEDLRAGSADVERLTTALANAEANVAAAELGLAEARQAEESARQVADARARCGSAREQLAVLEVRERELQTTLEREPDIRQALAHLAAAEAERTAALVARQALENEAQRLREQVARHRAEWAAARDAGRTASARAERARSRLRDRAGIELAVADAARLAVEIAEADRVVQECRERLDRLRSQHVTSADERIGRFRAVLNRIASASEDDDLRGIARGSLARDDHERQLAAELPAEIRAATTALDRASGEAHQLRLGLAQAERNAARAGELETAQSDLDAALAEIGQMIDRCESLKAAAAPLAEAAEAYSAAAREARDKASAASDRVDGLRDVAAHAPALADARSRLEELGSQLLAARGELFAAEESLATLPSTVGREEAARDARVAERDVTAAREAAVRARSALESAEHARRRFDALEGERTRAEEAVADWHVLARDLGRDGLQAALIDAAGPELTELCNDLLRTCHGSRFTIVVETTRLSADGKRQLEGLDVRVIDTQGGRDALVETYSGGERVILGEAVSLALTMLACRRAGLESPTLFRDESGAALDPDNARAYVAMLRRAAELLDAQVLFVSHSRDVQEMCDGQIVVAGGRVEVQA